MPEHPTPFLCPRLTPSEAPLAHVPGSVYFWWAFFALGVVAFAAGLWGMVLRRLRRHRLRAELALWPHTAPAAEQAQWLLELVRRHHLQPPTPWVQALDGWLSCAVPAQPAEAGNAAPNPAPGLGQTDASQPSLEALRDQVLEMPYVD